jgi:hypothetical protein
MRRSTIALTLLLSILVGSCRQVPYDPGNPGTVTYHVYGEFDLVDPAVAQLDITYTTAAGTTTQSFLAADMPAAPSAFSWSFQTDYVEGQSYRLQVVVTATALVSETASNAGDSLQTQLDSTVDLIDAAFVGNSFTAGNVQENDFLYHAGLDTIVDEVVSANNIKIADGLAADFVGGSPTYDYEIYARQSVGVTVTAVDSDGVETVATGQQTAGLLDLTTTL